MLQLFIEDKEFVWPLNILGCSFICLLPDNQSQDSVNRGWEAAKMKRPKRAQGPVQWDSSRYLHLFRFTTSRGQPLVRPEQFQGCSTATWFQEFLFPDTDFLFVLKSLSSDAKSFRLYKRLFFFYFFNVGCFLTAGFWADWCVTVLCHRDGPLWILTAAWWLWFLGNCPNPGSRSDHASVSTYSGHSLHLLLQVQPHTHTRWRISNHHVYYMTYYSSFFFLENW